MQYYLFTPPVMRLIAATPTPSTPPRPRARVWRAAVVLGVLALVVSVQTCVRAWALGLARGPPLNVASNYSTATDLYCSFPTHALPFLAGMFAAVVARDLPCGTLPHSPFTFPVVRSYQRGGEAGTTSHT
eukprot:TRINITY_DN14745_c0_g1_i1.p1 TRINITY_DN14745_c0_g1~~TRINITY_DN14745_c0_g1_i1.p1  ORF type:complete len:130 (+),score=25.27 TRINITY_DN14745_c0_g1_i1:268-657(+)